MDTVNNKLKTTFENKYVYGATILVAILYAGVAASKLPPEIAKLFDQDLFKLIVLFVIAYVSTYDVRIALILSIGFIVSIQSSNKISLEDQMKQLLIYNNLNSAQMLPNYGHNKMIKYNQTEGMKNIKQVLAPTKVVSDTGYETGTLQNGCYGNTTGTVGYDNADNLSAY